MSCEITADSVTVTGITRRQIPILHRYSSVSVPIPSGAGTRVTSNTTDTAQSIGSTGFVYQAPAIYRNTSGRTLICYVSYSVIWQPISANRLMWIQLDNLPNRYAMTCLNNGTLEPAQSASAVIIVPHNSFLTLLAFHNSGLIINLLTNYNKPYLNITII